MKKLLIASLALLLFTNNIVYSKQGNKTVERFSSENYSSDTLKDGFSSFLSLISQGVDPSSADSKDVLNEIYWTASLLTAIGSDDKKLQKKAIQLSKKNSKISNNAERRYLAKLLRSDASSSEIITELSSTLGFFDAEQVASIDTENLNDFVNYFSNHESDTNKAKQVNQNIKLMTTMIGSILTDDPAVEKKITNTVENFTEFKDDEFSSFLEDTIKAEAKSPEEVVVAMNELGQGEEKGNTEDPDATPDQAADDTGEASEVPPKDPVIETPVVIPPPPPPVKEPVAETPKKDPEVTPPPPPITHEEEPEVEVPNEEEEPVIEEPANPPQDQGEESNTEIEEPGLEDDGDDIITTDDDGQVPEDIDDETEDPIYEETGEVYTPTLFNTILEQLTGMQFWELANLATDLYNISESPAVKALNEASYFSKFSKLTAACEDVKNYITKDGRDNLAELLAKIDVVKQLLKNLQEAAYIKLEEVDLKYDEETLEEKMEHPDYYSARVSYDMITEALKVVSDSRFKIAQARLFMGQCISKGLYDGAEDDAEEEE